MNSLVTGNQFQNCIIQLNLFPSYSNYTAMTHPVTVGGFPLFQKNKGVEGKSTKLNYFHLKIRQPKFCLFLVFFLAQTIPLRKSRPTKVQGETSNRENRKEHIRSLFKKLHASIPFCFLGMSQRMTTYSVLIVTPNPNKGQSKLGVQELYYYKNLASFSVLKPHPIFVLHYYDYDTVKEEQEGRPEDGYVICWYCHKLEIVTYVNFECPPVPVTETRWNCYSKMLNAYKASINEGKQVRWRFDISTGSNSQRDLEDLALYLEEGKHGSPFDLQDPKDSPFAFASFIGPALNGTGIMDTFRDFSFMKIIPWIIFQPHWEQDVGSEGSECLYTQGQYDVYLQNHKETFKFITADGVKEARSSVSTFTEPFQWIVWIIIVLFMACVTCVITLLSLFKPLPAANPSYSCSTKCSAVILWLCSALVEQSTGKAPTGVKTKGLLQFCMIVWSMWILMGVILVNSYKGLLKTNYVVGNPLQTHLRTLKEIQQNNFSLYQAVDGHHCSKLSCIEKYGRTRDSADAQFCILDTTCNTSFHEYRECQLYNQLVEDKFYGMFSDIYQGYQIPDTYIHFICIDDIAQVIRNKRKLNRPKAAFVTTALDFPSHWNLFRDEMKKDRTLKFAHNLKVDDSYLSQNYYYCHSGGLSEYHKEAVPRRIKTMSSSGFYGLWDKWQRIRFPYSKATKGFELKKTAEDHVEPFRPLSLADSDIYLLFYLLVTLLGVNFFVFLSELFWGIFFVKICFRISFEVN